MKNEKLYPKEKQKGVVFYRNKLASQDMSEDPEDIDAIDIDVDDEVKEVVICYDLIMADSKKSFPNVESLVIKSNVFEIRIPNSLFPNVKWVQSERDRFKTGNCLVLDEGNIFCTLLNTFCKKEGEVIKIDDITAIKNGAFSGCESTNLTGAIDVYCGDDIEPDAFAGSAFAKQPFVILPKNNVYYCVPKRPRDCVRVPNVNAFAAMRKFPKKVIIEDENINYDDALLYNFCNRDIEELESRVPRYKTVDGILYSADMKTLILCPAGKTGTVVIPDGVTRIRKHAFSRSKISKVIFPDSMVSLQNEAFYGCAYLTEIDFGHGIEHIGGNGNQHVFSGCSMKRLVFPPQVKEIGINAFFSCGELKEVIFNEGLETIQRGAFRGCPRLTEIHLPTSIKKVGPEAFLCEVLREGIQDINVNMSTIPEDFGRAFIHPGNMQTPRCINVHIDNKDGIFDFVLPDCTSAVTPGYSEIVSACNLMAGREYDKKIRRLKSAFMYASNSRFKCVDAFKTYKKTKNESAKEYLSDYQKRTAEAIAMELTEKDFVDFLRLDFINLGYDKGIVKRLQEQNWNIALAYMLEEGREENNDALVI